MFMWPRNGLIDETQRVDTGPMLAHHIMFTMAALTMPVAIVPLLVRGGHAKMQ